MKNKTVSVLLIVTISWAIFMAAFKIPRVLAAAYNIPVDFPTIAAALASGVLVPGDQLHISSGYVEVLAAPLVISIPSLRIIGSPPATGPMPVIDVNGLSIIVAAPNVFIWGLNIVDLPNQSPRLLYLNPDSTNALIMNNTVQGSWTNTGIVVTGTHNIVTLNTINSCGIGIDVQGDPAGVVPMTDNVIKLNTLNFPTSIGIQVGNGAGPDNYMYWNSVWALPEFWDLTPNNPINYFTDPVFELGNYWAMTLPPPGIPFPIPGLGGNGWFDYNPVAVPMAQIRGDVNVDGRINIMDLAFVAVHYGQRWCQNGWDPRADLNGDGIINILDIVQLAINFGVSY